MFSKQCDFRYTLNFDLRVVTVTTTHKYTRNDYVIESWFDIVPEDIPALTRVI